jgi:hypothetical protein
MSAFSLLLSNPYAILENEIPKKQTNKDRSNAKIMYNVVTGKDLVSSELSPAQEGGLNTTTTSTTLYGNCYICKYKSHFQRQCPLSKCTICGSFGHAASICQSVQ